MGIIVSLWLLLFLSCQMGGKVVDWGFEIRVVHGVLGI